MPHGRPAKNSCQRVCMPGVRTWFFIARCGNGDSSTRTKTWRKPRCPNCKRCKNDGADSWACLNLFEAEIAFRLGEIHIYLKNHQIQTSEFQSFCDRWIVFSPWRNDDFLKKNSISRPHFPVRRDVYVYIHIYIYIYVCICVYIYYVYIYIYIMYTYIYIYYVYIYIYVTYIYMYIFTVRVYTYTSIRTRKKYPQWVSYQCSWKRMTRSVHIFRRCHWSPEELPAATCR